MLRTLTLLALAASLGACDRLGDAFAGRVDKITRAAPLTVGTQAAHAALMTAASADKAVTQRIEREFAQWLEVRALSCSTGVDVGRFDSVEQLRAKLSNKECFAEKDAQLAEWIGISRVGIELVRPALVPAKPLSDKAMVPTQGSWAPYAVAAGDADVMVLLGPEDKMTAVEVPGAKVISAARKPERSPDFARLSPNGRLLAFGLGRSVELFSVESGEPLWKTDRFSELIGWLPETQALVMQRARQDGASLVDARTGRIEPHTAADVRSTWSVAAAGQPGRHWIGGDHTAALVEHSRDAQGKLSVTLVKTWRLPLRVSTPQPFTMAAGRKLVYPSGGDLAWFDLESGQHGSWQFSLLRAQGFSKISETTVLFDTAEQTSPTKTVRLLDIEAATASTLPASELAGGALMPLGTRVGWARRGAAAVTLGGALSGENPQPVERLLADAAMERQLAVLKAQTDAAERAAAADAPPPGKPMLHNVPSDAQVMVLGVYEAANKGRLGTGQRGGTVRVTLTPSPTPVVLVLASYESTQWIVQGGGRKVSAVLLSGYEDSSVAGVGSDKTVRIGGHYAYSMDSPDYLKLKRDIARYVANPVRLFQGKYAGTEFTIGAH